MWNDDYWRGKKMLWFEGEQLRCAGWVFAEYKGLPKEVSLDDIAVEIRRMFGAIEVDFGEQGEFTILEE